VAERQETKHEYPNSSPDEAQSLTESVSAPKEETTEVKNTTESQTNVPADGKIHSCGQSCIPWSLLE
jgi:hypothetical protein